jgi:hypothetical protein
VPRRAGILPAFLNLVFDFGFQFPFALRISTVAARPRNSLPFRPMDHIRRRRNLPHLETDGGIYFVTFRLADSLPRIALQRIQDGLHPKSNCDRESSI